MATVALECNPAREINWRMNLETLASPSSMPTSNSPVFRQIPDKRFQRSFVKSLAHPVERRAEVVHELLARVNGVHIAGQFAGLGNIRVAGLNPQEVAVRSKFLSALCGSGEASAVVVESFTSARDVARPDNR